jgi:transcriptional regulator with XRE-family HTH domain
VVVDYTQTEPAVLLGTRIRSARLGFGLSQRELAVEARVHVGRLSDYENGHRDATLSHVVAIAKALETPVGVFVACLEGGQKEMF